MASIQIKKGKHYVVYNYTDETGARKQKWEPCKSEAHAKKRKKEIEYKEGIGQIVALSVFQQQSTDKELHSSIHWKYEAE